MPKKVSNSCHAEGASENAFCSRKSSSSTFKQCTANSCESSKCLDEISDTNYILLSVQKVIKAASNSVKVWHRLPLYSRYGLLLCAFPFLVIPVLTGLLFVPFALAIIAGVYCAAFSPATFVSHAQKAAEEYVDLAKLSAAIKSNFQSIYSRLNLEKTKNALFMCKQKSYDVASILYYKFIAFLYMLYATTATKARNTLTCSVDVISETGGNGQDSSPMFDLAAE